MCTFQRGQIKVKIGDEQSIIRRLGARREDEEPSVLIVTHLSASHFSSVLSLNVLLTNYTFTPSLKHRPILESIFLFHLLILVSRLCLTMINLLPA